MDWEDAIDEVSGMVQDTKKLRRNNKLLKEKLREVTEDRDILQHKLEHRGCVACGNPVEVRCDECL